MDTGLKPPIFLFGNVRSGTSMMHDLFDAHPGVVSWSEPRTIWTYADPGRRHDRFDAADATPRVRRYIRKRFLQYQRRHGDRRVMEKTPSNMLRIPYVHAIFPESKLLYIVREPLANLSSTDLMWSNKSINRSRTWRRLRETPTTQIPYFLSRFLVDFTRSKILHKKRVSIWGVRYPGIYEDLKRMSTEEVIAKQWVACVNRAEEDFAQLDADLVLRMRYEAFVADPVGHFERICEHVDLEMTPQFAAHIRAFVDPTRQRKWTRLDPELLRRCLPIYRDAMARLGYEVPADAAELLHDGAASGGGR